jgi:hypothetical protein
VATPLIHIGYHKTGTTWLQENLFVSADVGFLSCGGETEVKRKIARPHDLEFDPEPARAAFARWFERADREGLVPVLSAERLCGDMLYGAYDSAQIAERLAATFPGARVLIVIREQRAMVFSSYHQYVKSGGRLRLERYLSRPAYPHPWPFNLRHFQYHRLIQRYIHLFGVDNVLVLPYELFRKDPRQYLARIAEFAVAAEHARVGDLQFHESANMAWPATAILTKRYVNALVRDRLNPWAPIDGEGFSRRAKSVIVKTARRLPPKLERRAQARMRATIETHLADRYRESNGITSGLIGEDLGSFGYDMPAEAPRAADRGGDSALV